MKKIPKKVIGNIGQCIYCGEKREKLTDEHIVPFGINGHWVLKKASCKKCAAITSNFEQDILRKSLLKPRIALDLPTRNKKKRPKFLEIDVLKNGVRKTIQLDPKDNFSLIALPIYLPPAYVDRRKIEKGISFKGYKYGQISGPSIDILGKKYDFDTISETVTWTANSFPRLLSKIAYGFSVAMYGLDIMEKNYVMPYILGEKFDGISEWVGSAPDEIMVEKGLHTISGGINEKRDIAVRIKLFDLWNTPEYVVIVGKANLNSLKVPIKSESDRFYRPY